MSQYGEEKEIRGFFPRGKGYLIIMILMGIVAVGLLAAMIMVNTFPVDLTLTLIALMLGLFVLAVFLMGRKDSKPKRIAGVAVAMVFMLIFGAATYYLGTTYVMLNRISGGESIENEGIKPADIDPTEEPFNLYITGIDQWEAEKGEDLERSDVNMIVTVNPKTKKILLTSIPRDSYVKLHTAKQMDKLTHTGVYGVDETLNTVEDWLGVKSHYYVKMNFSAVRDIINAMDGIKLYNPVKFGSDIDDYVFDKGWIWLSGREALYYARERHAFEGKDDIRVENQQRVMKAVIDRVTSSTTLLTNYGDIMDAARRNLKTNMRYSEIRDLVKMQITDLSKWDVESQKIEGYYDEDYVASLTQEQKFQVYRTSKGSEKACVDAINRVMNPTQEELKKAADKHRKSFFVNVGRRMIEKIKKE